MIYDKSKLIGRTWISITNMLFNMGKSLEGVVEDKQDTLIAGYGINISSTNVISATGGGGGGITVDTGLDADSVNPVENKAITLKINGIDEDISTLQGRTLSDMGLTYTDIEIED